jgi:hypothetical protein
MQLAPVQWRVLPYPRLPGRSTEHRFSLRGVATEDDANMFKDVHHLLTGVGSRQAALNPSTAMTSNRKRKLFLAG